MPNITLTTYSISNNNYNSNDNSDNVAHQRKFFHDFTSFSFQSQNYYFLQSLFSYYCFVSYSVHLFFLTVTPWKPICIFLLHSEHFRIFVVMLEIFPFLLYHLLLHFALIYYFHRNVHFDILSFH